MHAPKLVLSLIVPLLAAWINAGEEYTLSDLAPRTLFSADGYLDYCVLVYMEMNPQPRTRVFLFDTEAKKGVFIEDPRVNLPTLPRVVLKQDTIILASFPNLGDPKLHLFDKQGKIDKVLDLARFRGWEDNFSALEIFNFKKDSLLLSAETLSFDRQRESDTFILEVFWKERRVETINHIKKKRPEYKIYWAPLGNNFLEIEGVSGSIHLIDKISFARTELFKPLPIEINERAHILKKSHPNAGASNRASLKYHADWIIPLGDKVALQHSMPSVKTGTYEPMMLVLDQNGKIIDKGTQLLIWSTPKVSVYFNFEEGEFSLKPPLK